MKLEAISEAYERLAWANDHFKKAVAARDHATFKREWIGFLERLNTILPKLVSGAADREWGKKKKAEIDSDQLLRYLREACNNEKHGIEPVSGPQQVVAIGSGTMKGTLRIHNGKIKVTPMAGELVPSVDVFVTGMLYPVTKTERGKVIVIDVPRQHLGSDLPTIDPTCVGSVGMGYYRRLIKEAEQQT